MALDGWKKIESQKPADGAERVRQQRDVSAYDRAGDEKPRLTRALDQLTPKAPETPNDSRAPKDFRTETREAPTPTRPEQNQKGQTAAAAHPTAKPAPETPKKVLSQGTTPGHSPNGDPKHRSINFTAAQAASTFVIKPQELPLANLLTGRALPPASPKGTEAEGKKPSVPNSPQEILQTKQDLKGVAALPQAPQGSKTPDASIKKEDRGTEKRGEEKRSSGTSKNEKSGGKGGVAHTEAGRADGESSLQAASGGVTSGGSEPVWIADQDPGIEVYNEEGSRDSVRASHSLFKQYVIKSPAKSKEVLYIFEKALRLDSDLEQILKQGLAARLNVYGGTSA